jgi:hypothetical protein
MLMAGAGLLACALPGAVAAQSAPQSAPHSAPNSAPHSAPNSAQGDVSVTIYNNNLALIQDIRQLSLPSGRTQQEFPDVSAQIQPQTVTLAVPDAGIVEQNFDYDLLSPERLMDKAVGQTVTLVRTSPASGAETSEPAQVLANNGGTLLKVGSRIEVLGSAPNARVVFTGLPPGLKANPTLSVTLNSARAGTRPATLSYLSQGFAWKADYVALFDETQGRIDVQGWITLHNTSGTSYGNARVLLVAGQVGSDGNDRYRPRSYAPPPPGNRPGTQSADRERLGDFYVYPIAGRTTLANQQQKQVSFLDVKAAPASKGYVFRNGWLASQNEAQSFDTVLRFSTAAEGGLGDALPAGTVRVYMRDARGQPQFIGENEIDHMPMGSTLAIKTGEAFDVKLKATVDKRERIETDEWERGAKWRVSVNGGPPKVYTVDHAITYWRTSMSYHITNARPQPVTVEVLQDGLDAPWWHDTRVPSESIKGEQRSLDERAWLVPVPANGEATLTVQFYTRY